MGFMSRYAGTLTVDVTDLADDDGNEYWVKIKKTLSGEELDRAEAAHMRLGAQGGVSKAVKDAAERKKRARSGQVAEDDVDMTTMVTIDTPAYKKAILELGVVDWNLTDEHGRPLLLRPADARSRSIAGLPPVVRDRLFQEIVAASKPEPRTAAEEADFPGALPVGGETQDEYEPADPGDLAPGGLVVAHWADAGEGVGDLQSA